METAKTATPRPMVPLVQRFVPALRLDPALYSDIANDPQTRGQAFLVVLAAGVLNGIALRDRLGVFAIWGGVSASLIGWGLWTWVIQLVAWIARCRRDGRSIARPIGFANAPGCLLVLALIPDLTTIVRIGVPLWLVATSVAAVHAAYATTYLRASLITLTAFILYLAIGMVMAFV